MMGQSRKTTFICIAVAIVFIIAYIESYIKQSSSDAFVEAKSFAISSPDIRRVTGDIKGIRLDKLGSEHEYNFNGDALIYLYIEGSRSSIKERVELYERNGAWRVGGASQIG